MDVNDATTVSTDSTTAFQVQNTSAQNLLQVDTEGNNIVIGGKQVWQTDANALPSARSGHASVVANGYVYTIGGLLGDQTAVYYAELNPDGSTGSWQTNANALPASR
ncbi:MAG: kelch repeat-containing protein, partial [Patescibacteria group bacterium]